MPSPLPSPSLIRPQALVNDMDDLHGRLSGFEKEILGADQSTPRPKKLVMVLCCLLLVIPSDQFRKTPRAAAPEVTLANGRGKGVDSNTSNLSKVSEAISGPFGFDPLPSAIKVNLPFSPFNFSTPPPRKSLDGALTTRSTRLPTARNL